MTPMKHLEIKLKVSPPVSLITKRNSQRPRHPKVEVHSRKSLFRIQSSVKFYFF